MLVWLVIEDLLRRREAQTVSMLMLRLVVCELVSDLHPGGNFARVLPGGLSLFRLSNFLLLGLRKQFIVVCPRIVSIVEVRVLSRGNTPKVGGSNSTSIFFDGIIVSREPRRTSWKSHFAARPMAVAR